MAQPKTPKPAKTQVFAHPSFPDVTREVPEADAESWREQGWKRVAKDRAPDPVQQPTTTITGSGNVASNTDPIVVDDLADLA